MIEVRELKEDYGNPLFDALYKIFPAIAEDTMRFIPKGRNSLVLVMKSGRPNKIWSFWSADDWSLVTQKFFGVAQHTYDWQDLQVEDELNED